MTTEPRQSFMDALIERYAAQESGSVRAMLGNPVRRLTEHQFQARLEELKATCGLNDYLDMKIVREREGEPLPAGFSWDGFVKEVKHWLKTLPEDSKVAAPMRQMVASYLQEDAGSYGLALSRVVHFTREVMALDEMDSDRLLQKREVILYKLLNQCAYFYEARQAGYQERLANAASMGMGFAGAALNPEQSIARNIDQHFGAADDSFIMIFSMYMRNTPVWDQTHDMFHFVTRYVDEVMPRASEADKGELVNGLVQHLLESLRDAFAALPVGVAGDRGKAQATIDYMLELGSLRNDVLHQAGHGRHAGYNHFDFGEMGITEERRIQVPVEFLL